MYNASAGQEFPSWTFSPQSPSDVRDAKWGKPEIDQIKQCRPKFVAVNAVNRDEIDDCCQDPDRYPAADKTGLPHLREQVAELPEQQ